jgi:hypothetical protein
MYTVEIYRKDSRTKSGERCVLKANYATDDLRTLEHSVRDTWPTSQGYRYVIHETLVTRRNALTGEEYQERYDTPRSCSPSSEAYWSM